MASSSSSASFSPLLDIELSQGTPKDIIVNHKQIKLSQSISFLISPIRLNLTNAVDSRATIHILSLSSFAENKVNVTPESS